MIVSPATVLAMARVIDRQGLVCVPQPAPSTALLATKSVLARAAGASAQSNTRDAVQRMGIDDARVMMFPPSVIASPSLTTTRQLCFLLLVDACFYLSMPASIFRDLQVSICRCRVALPASISICFVYASDRFPLQANPL